MNTYVSGLGSMVPAGSYIPGQSPYKVFRKTSDMVAPGPSKTWVLIDEREDSINNSFFTLQTDSIQPLEPLKFYFINWPASYHGQAAAVNFADGHSEIKKWSDPRTMPKIRKSNLPNNGSVLSPKNRDLEWLLVHATARK